MGRGLWGVRNRQQRADGAQGGREARVAEEQDCGHCMGRGQDLVIPARHEPRAHRRRRALSVDGTRSNESAMPIGGEDQLDLFVAVGQNVTQIDQPETYMAKALTRHGYQGSGRSLARRMRIMRHFGLWNVPHSAARGLLLGITRAGAGDDVRASEAVLQRDTTVRGSDGVEMDQENAPTMWIVGALCMAIEERSPSGAWECISSQAPDEPL
jgi:hypothetical protein